MKSFSAGESRWQTFFYAEYVRTGGSVRYGLADTTVNGRLGRIWVPDAAAFTPNRIINPVKMERLELIRPACSIETGSLNQDVSLGNYLVSDLRNGKVTPGWQTFRLTMLLSGSWAIACAATRATMATASCKGHRGNIVCSTGADDRRLDRHCNRRPLSMIGKTRQPCRSGDRKSVV